MTRCPFLKRRSQLCSESTDSADSPLKRCEPPSRHQNCRCHRPRLMPPVPISNCSFPVCDWSICNANIVPENRGLSATTRLRRRPAKRRRRAATAKACRRRDPAISPRSGQNRCGHDARRGCRPDCSSRSARHQDLGRNCARNSTEQSYAIAFERNISCPVSISISFVTKSKCKMS